MKKRSFQKNRFTKKKGAIELSMTTIIVIIMGVTLLSLGLVWVRGTFKEIQDLSDSSLSKGKEAISDIFSDVSDPVTLIPEKLELAQGSVETVELIIANFGEETIKAKAKISVEDKTVDCKFAGTNKLESKEYTITSGKQVSVQMIVQERNGPLGVKVCNVDVPVIEGDNSRSLIIEVVKKTGLF